MQSYQGTEVYTDVYVFDFTYADDFMLLSKNYREMPVLLEAGNQPATAVGVPIKASKTKVMSALAAATNLDRSALSILQSRLWSELIQRMLRLFGYDLRRPDGEL